MAQALTKEYLDQALGNLATRHDTKRLDDRIDKLQASVADLHSSIDRYLKRTETWHDEFMVLQARYDRLVHLLDQKGLVREEETHLG